MELRECLQELKDLQKLHDQLESQYHHKLSRIQAEFMNSIEPICSERLRLVSSTDGKDGSETTGGISRFWLTVMTGMNDFPKKQIPYRDRHALSFLTDIKWSPLNDHMGWKLDFFFDSCNNPYFDNPVLTKEVYFSMVRGRRCIERIEGTEINWYPGECLLQKTVKKLNKKVLVKADSFFEFFVISNVEECDHLIDFCQLFMRRIIPHAQASFYNALRIMDKLETEYPFLSNGAGKSFLHEGKLIELKFQVKGLESKMFQQMRDVDESFWDSVKPLHQKRSELVSQFLVAQMSSLGREETEEESGTVFWLNAMKNEETLRLMISEQDAKALRYLKDIKFTKRVEVGPRYALYTWAFEFFFNPNPYFSNAVLRKELSTSSIEGFDLPGNSQGTDIEWLPGGFLLDDPEQVVAVQSFFNLFNGKSDEGYTWFESRSQFQSRGTPTLSQNSRVYEHIIEGKILDETLKYVKS